MNPTQDQLPSGIGNALKDARRRIGMDVKEAEERTKIRAKYLRALEAEDWEVLPAPAYVRGFLRTYGALLGLDGEMLADEFRRRYEEVPALASGGSEPLLQERRRASGSRPPSRGPLIAGIAIGIIILLVILGSIGDDDGDPASDGGKPAKKLKADGGGKKDRSPEPLEPIDVALEPADAISICLVGSEDAALVDSQVLSAGTEQQFSGFKRYRLDLQGAGTVKITAGSESERVVSEETASFEADSKGIREVEYAGPDCP